MAAADGGGLVRWQGRCEAEAGHGIEAGGDERCLGGEAAAVAGPRDDPINALLQRDDRRARLEPSAAVRNHARGQLRDTALEAVAPDLDDAVGGAVEIAAAVQELARRHQRL